MPGDPGKTTIVGLLVDVSASMRESLRNDSKDAVSRLDGWTGALRRAAERAEAARRERPGSPAGDSSVRVFAYAFGTRRIGPVVDLLTLLSLRDRHGSGGGSAADVPAPPPSPDGDPYAELKELALHEGREGWILWLERNLTPDEAATLAANLRGSRRLRKEIADSLPRLSRDEFLLAENHSRKRMILGGPSYGFQAAKLSAKAQLGDYRSRTADAERIVRRLASRRMTFADLLEDRLAEAGWTTLSVTGLAGILSRLAAAGPVDTELTEFLYGGTPLTRAVKEAVRRLADERRPVPRGATDSIWKMVAETPTWMVLVLGLLWLSAPREGRTKPREAERLLDTNEILFIVSDGASTDGDPAAELARLRASGTTVVSCYIGATDAVENVRTLPVTASPSWDLGARQLFEYASPVPAGHLRDHLREKGWRIPRGARLFIQANHSDVLSEIAELLLRSDS